MPSANLRLIMNDNFTCSFSLEEAFSLMRRTVMLQSSNNSPAITNIGVIAGVLDINDEIEIVVRFMDRIEQYTKAELKNKTVFIAEGEV